MWSCQIRPNRRTSGMVLLTVFWMFVLYTRAGAQTHPTDSSAQSPSGATIAPGAPRTATYAEMLAQFRLTQKDSDMRAAFPAMGMGPALARIAVLYPYGLRQDNIPEARQMAFDLAQLRTGPEHALADLQTGFQHLPEKYWAERQFLIQMGARLAAPQAKVLDFLKQEISRPTPQATGEPTNLSYYSPAVAAEELLEIVGDPEQRDAALLEAIKAQPDKNIRRLVLSRYEMVDATRAKHLATLADLDR